MAFDEKTKTAIASANIAESQELYPHATVFSDHNATLNPWTGQTVLRLNTDELPSTTRDMSAVFTWVKGTKVYGTQAKEAPAQKRYRNDINRAYGQQDKYKDFYVDTLTRPDLISQLKDLKKV